MASPRQNQKDFWAGLIYIVLGASAVVIGRDYGMGTTSKMGPGYFPTILGGLLVLVGVLSVARALRERGSPVGVFGFRAMLLVIGSVLVFGLIVRGAGLAIALPVLVLISSGASVRFRWGSALALAAGLTLLCILVFLKGLGVPLPVLGRWFGG